MNLYVLSDLHLDLYPFKPDSAALDAADVVVLAGDVDEGLKGLRWAKETFGEKPVIYVAGNHEFYSRDWNKHLRDMRVLASELGIHFLERDAVEIDGVRFLGCSLWTDFEINGKEKTTPRSACARHSTG